MRDWEEDHLKWDANDLIAKIWTWQHGDISDNESTAATSPARQTIEARAIVMPCSTDMYFRPRITRRKSARCNTPNFASSSRRGAIAPVRPGRSPSSGRLDEAAAELLRG